MDNDEERRACEERRALEERAREGDDMAGGGAAWLILAAIFGLAVFCGVIWMAFR